MSPSHAAEPPFQPPIHQQTPSAPKGSRPRGRGAKRISAREGSTSSSRQLKRPKLSHEKWPLGCDPVRGDSTTQAKGCVPQPAEIPKSEAIADLVESFMPSTSQNVDAFNSSVSHTLLVKDSYPLLNQRHERGILHSVKDLFRVPEILCAHVVEDSRRVEDKTSTFLPDNTVYWSVFNDPELSRGPELRVRMRFICNTSGHSLNKAPCQCQCQLLQSILDTMAGHWNLFNAGWLHRDISVGNILGLLEKETRPAVADFDVTKDRRDCTVIRWKDSEMEVASRRSCTLPFISVRLMRTWVKGRSDLHTASDDLESFVWVLVWTILVVSRSIQGLTMAESGWLTSMDDMDLATVTVFKSNFRSELEWERGAGVPDLSAGLKLFAPLFSEWLLIAEKARVDVRDVLFNSPSLRVRHELEKTTKIHLERYLVAGYEALSKISQESWAQVFGIPTGIITQFDTPVVL